MQVTNTDVNAFPERHRDIWLPFEETQLRRCYCWMPFRKLAKLLGRTEDAVLQRARAMHLQVVEDRPDVLTIGQFADVMGINRQAARRLATNSRFSETMYRRNQKVMVVMVDELKNFLKDPLNWRELDVTKITHPDLIAIVEQAKGSGRDCWMTIAEAADYAHYSYWGMHKLVARLKKIPSVKGSQGIKGRKKNLVRRSDIDAYLSRSAGD